MTKSVNQRNSWRFVPSLNRNEGEKKFKDRWESLPYYNVSIERDERVFENPLQALRCHIKNGMFPPPELLVWLDESFAYYFEKGGEVELEDVFFGHRTPRGGNEARRCSGLIEYFPVFSDYITFKKHNTIKQNADDFLFSLSCGRVPLGFDIKPLDTVPDVESFLSQWRRWKRANK